MSSSSQPLSHSKWLLKISAFAIFGLLLLARIGYGQTQTVDTQQGVLQGSIQLQLVQPVPGDQTGKIQPGTSVKLNVTVENKGPYPTPPGEIYVRYAFAHPLENEKGSLIFETEKKKLSALDPGKQVVITFDTPHQIPSLLDFVRYDWSIREYQAIAVIQHEEHMIGTLALTFSAYYYPGIKKEFPTQIKATP